MALMKKPGAINPVALLLFSVWILWAFGIETVYARLKLELDGVVISARQSEYILRGPRGDTFHYVAGPTDASLPRSMPVGTHLKKLRWHLNYERNGQQVNDFPVFFYLGFLGIAVVCIGWSFVSAWSRTAFPELGHFALQHEPSSINNDSSLGEPARSYGPRTFWKTVSVILIVLLAVSFIINISMYWWPNIPSSPNPSEGRVYPLNNHGHYTYMNRNEYTLNESLSWAFPALFFPLAAIEHFLDPFNQKRRWQRVQPPRPWLQ